MKLIRRLRNGKKLRKYIFVALVALALPHVGHDQAWYEHVQKNTTPTVEQAWTGHIARNVPPRATIHNLDAWESLITRRA